MFCTFYCSNFLFIINIVLFKVWWFSNSSKYAETTINKVNLFYLQNSNNKVDSLVTPQFSVLHVKTFDSLISHSKTYWWSYFLPNSCYVSLYVNKIFRFDKCFCVCTIPLIHFRYSVWGIYKIKFLFLLDFVKSLLVTLPDLDHLLKKLIHYKLQTYKFSWFWELDMSQWACEWHLDFIQYVIICTVLYYM